MISGAGALTKTGAGALILLGANTWTGTTTISTGTLQVGNGGTSGALGTGAIIDNGTLVFDRSDAVALPAGLTGTGALIQQGSGTFTVNGDDSGFAGTTTVKAGIATVGDDNHASARLGGMVTVAKGATLNGIGTIGGLDAFGTVSPGGSIGTFHVIGDAMFESGSTFNVEANANGTADQLAVGGKTTIKGGNTVVLSQPGNWSPSTSYTIITSGAGVTGTFAGVSDDQVFLTPTLAYGTDDVTLTLARNNINFGSVAQNPNQQGSAGGIEGIGFGNALYDAVVKLNAADAQTAFEQTAGEYHASQQTARVEDSRYIREAMNQRLRNGDHDTEAAKVGDTKLTAWAHGWGHWGTVDSDGNAAKLADNGDGLLVGADMPVGAARVGVAGGASRNSLSLNDRASWGRETSTWLGAFAGVDVNAFSLRGGFAYAWDRIPSNREINFPGYTDRLSGNASGDTLTGFIEGSWTFHFASGTVSPFLNVAHTKVETDASTEAGGAAALHSYDNTANVSFSTLGARGAINFAHNLNLHGELGWQHAFGDTTPGANLQFVAGGPAFTEYGVPGAKNAGLGRIGIGWHQGNVALDADYEGLAGNGVKDQAAKVSVSVTF
ncbi:MAG: autotransporter domain-containing protein [Rhodanobacteraceae bacterium]|nr:MAG: autotransporter domain-containing protein [Rhodanobacteraceae bacterium]